VSRSSPAGLRVTTGSTLTPNDVHNVQFHKPRIGLRGYDEQAVDELLDRIEESLDGRSAITLEELIVVRFPKPPLGHRGYLKADVDTFLQLVIAEWPTPAESDQQPA
jgi:DivIVA domain-containing protein